MTSDTQERKTPAQREADKAFKQVEADKAVSDHAAAQIAFHKNRERLKAERIAREASRLELHQVERVKPRVHNLWTSADHNLLRSLIKAGVPISDVATRLNRTIAAVRVRAANSKLR